MASLFGPSEQDLERLRSTVQSLGTTSVPGLAAALSWRERKAEKLLAHELHRPGTPLVYDPGRRTVRWAVLPVPVAPAEPSALPDTSRSGALRPPPAPAPVFTPAGIKTLCPSCHVALQSTGSGTLAVCPKCGRLSSVHTGVSGRADLVPSAAPAPTPTPTTAGDSPLPLSDRRSQEMFAAWVTAQPIPCPKCRTPLRHRGVSEYACPSCGQMVKFPTISSAPTPAATPAVPPS
jgi:predicted RNA-binding Zn-ribbon protein involved in translation (DUF1610 family)